MTDPGTQTPPPELLAVIANLARSHHQHEQFYAQSPLRDAVALEAHSRALKALAAHWSVTRPVEGSMPNPYAGADDLNAPGLVAANGVLFMEGGEEPAELARLREELRSLAEAVEGTGAWLAGAMEQSWQVLGALVAYPALADVLGERHQIVVNDSLAAGMQTMIARLLTRALDLLAQVDFSPPSLRQDLAGARIAPAYLLSASELIDRAADLLTESATLVHENERRWRLFSARVAELSMAGAHPGSPAT
ncbi:MAG: hypothetical protein JST59_06950 [Actinobacteria bacterium]|nr:hypothetical protein [Actinomycetota bacterium]